MSQFYKGADRLLHDPAWACSAPALEAFLSGTRTKIYPEKCGRILDEEDVEVVVGSSQKIRCRTC